MKIIILISTILALPSLQKRGTSDIIAEAISYTPLHEGLKFVKQPAKQLEKIPKSRSPTYVRRISKGMPSQERARMSDEELSELLHLIQTGRIHGNDVSPTFDKDGPAFVNNRASRRRQANPSKDGFNPREKLDSDRFKELMALNSGERKLPTATFDQRIPPPIDLNQPKLVLDFSDSPRTIDYPIDPKFLSEAKQRLEANEIRQSTLNAIEGFHIGKMNSLKPIKTSTNANSQRS